MRTLELYQFIQQLGAGIHPITRVASSEEAVLFHPAVQELLSKLEQLLAKMMQAEATNQASDEKEGPSKAAVEALARRLSALGMKVSPTQMARIYRGSRSVIAPQLRSMAVFGRYRGAMTEKALVAKIKQLLASPTTEKADKNQEKCEQASVLPQAEGLAQVQEASPKVSKEKEAWEEETFFQELAYDMVSEGQLIAWQQQIATMALRRQTERLPGYLRAARTQYPRSFEPWQAEERALLMEVMCYTNRLDRLVAVFGRSLSALEREGKKLIYKSRQKRA